MTDSPSAASLPGRMNVAPADAPFAVAIACSRSPLPMTRADQMTVAHLIAFLAARGHSVDLYALDTGEKTTAEARDWLAANCRTLRLFPHGLVRSLAGLIQGLFRGWPLQVGWFLDGAQIHAVRDGLASADIGYGYYIRSAQAMRGLRTVRPTFLAMQLSQSLNTRRMAAHYRNPWERLLYAAESRLVRGYEARIWRDFTRTVLIGRRDLNEIRAVCRMRNLAGIDNVVFGPHGTDIERFAPRDNVAPEPCSLVFSGVMRTYTNVDAITWFADEVWPLVREAEPSATLAIVGRDPRREVRALARRDGITVTGDVADPADHIACAAVCIDPVRAGAGMQNKLIEFLELEKPVVATTVANEGIGATVGEHLLIADGPRSFAESILALFADSGRAAALGAAARKFVVERWSWEAHFLALEAEMRRAIDEARTA